MTVTFTPEIEAIIRNQVLAGQYTSPEELVREAVRMFLYGDFLPGELARLCQEGMDDVDAGRVVDGETFMAELRQRRNPRVGP